MELEESSSMSSNDTSKQNSLSEASNKSNEVESVPMFDCERCDFQVSDIIEMLDHIKSIHTAPNSNVIRPPKQFKCPKCNFKSDKRRVAFHVDLFHNQQEPKAPSVWFNCKQCYFRSLKPEVLACHVEKHNSKRKSADIESVNKRMKKETREFEFECSRCSFKSETCVGIAFHFKSHIGEKEDDGKNLKSNPEKDVEQSVDQQSHQPDKIIQSLGNGTKSKNRKGEILKCDNCPMQTVHRSSLIRHFKSEHPNKNIPESAYQRKKQGKKNNNMELEI